MQYLYRPARKLLPVFTGLHTGEADKAAAEIALIGNAHLFGDFADGQGSGGKQ